MYTVVLDACVLFPNVLRDTLLTLAEHELFRPRWSERILDEVRRNVIAKRRVNASVLDRTIALMNESFQDALVANWKPIVPEIELPDCDDRHVVAAAIAGDGQAIVTVNLADFPTSQLSQYQAPSTGEVAYSTVAGSP